MNSYLTSSDSSLVNTMLSSKQGNVFHADTLGIRAAVGNELRSSFSKRDQRRVSQYSLCVNDSQQGKTFWDTYTLGQLLGEGGYANVFTCRHKENDHLYAVKEVDDAEYDEGSMSIKQEIDVMKTLFECPLIVRLHDVFRLEGKTFLTMERLEGGDLLDALYRKGSYSEKDAKKVGRSLLEAVAYCHKKRIVHRDIKPENILLASEDNDTYIKICDFGSSKVLSGDGPDCLRTMVGSAGYCAPEIYDNENGYDQQCDLWSTGVVIYLLHCGYLSIDGEAFQIPALTCEGYYTFPDKQWGSISEAPKDLIRKLLVVDPKERLTAHQALNSQSLRRTGQSQCNFRLTKAPVSAFEHAPTKAYSICATCA
jgi:serine/threonine protein kinase